MLETAYMDARYAGTEANTETASSYSEIPAESALSRAERIASDVLAQYADDVDQRARFPHEALSALRSAKLLSAAIPKDFGGLGCAVPALSKICTALARRCAATAMIAAMHYGQTYMLSRHSRASPYLRNRLEHISGHQLLVASATSEVGVRDIGTSRAALVCENERFQLEKRCSVLSYAEYTDEILATGRRSPAAAASDQLFVLLSKDQFELRDLGAWNSLGMRGTCSPSATLRARGSTEQILPASYREIAERSMIPISNVLWSSVWLGIAEAAFATAHKRVQMSDASATLGEIPGSRRLAQTASALQLMRNNVVSTAGDCESDHSLTQEYTEERVIALIVRTNSLKVASSELVWRICHKCLSICGVAGYVNSSPFSLGRHLRDSLSAALMLGNDRIEATNAALLLLHLETP